MYVGTLGERPGTDEEAEASAAASRRAAAEWYQKYQADCKNIRILEHLTREPMGLYEEYILLRNRMKELPKLFEDKGKLDERARLWPKTRVFADPALERRRIAQIASDIFKRKIGNSAIIAGRPQQYTNISAACRKLPG